MANKSRVFHTVAQRDLVSYEVSRHERRKGSSVHTCTVLLFVPTVYVHLQQLMALSGIQTRRKLVN